MCGLAGGDGTTLMVTLTVLVLLVFTAEQEAVVLGDFMLYSTCGILLLNLDIPTNGLTTQMVTLMSSPSHFHRWDRVLLQDSTLTMLLCRLVCFGSSLTGIIVIQCVDAVIDLVAIIIKCYTLNHHGLIINGVLNVNITVVRDIVTADVSMAGTITPSQEHNQ